MNPKSIKSEFSQFRFYIHGNWPRMVWLAQISDPLCLVNAIFSSEGERKKKKGNGMCDNCILLRWGWWAFGLGTYLEFVCTVISNCTPMTCVLIWWSKCPTLIQYSLKMLKRIQCWNFSLIISKTTVDDFSQYLCLPTSIWLC